jgi:hypothetical protein
MVQLTSVCYRPAEVCSEGCLQALAQNLSSSSVEPNPSSSFMHKSWAQSQHRP